MKYLGYLIIALALFLGYVRFHLIAVLVLSLASTFLHASARRKALKEQIHAPDQNMVVDGVYLLAIQILIIFSVYALGYLAGTDAGDSFMEFLHIK